ncbi:MAG: hypothetical protein ACI9VM_000652 [Candidatus Azotimanducaceae bacterium]|jgi:hypothetical protein
MATHSNQLQKQIMRRVYYAFARRTVTHTLTLQLSLFCLALFVFAKMVHVSSVIDNMLATNLANLPQFVIGAVFQGEVLTLMAIGALTFTLLFVPMQVRALFVPHMQAV